MTEKTINVDRLDQIISVFGSFDVNITLLERELGVRVINRDTELKVAGEAEAVDRAVRVIESLLSLSSRGEPINEQNIRYVMDLVAENHEDKIQELTGDVICITVKGRTIQIFTFGNKMIMAERSFLIVKITAIRCLDWFFVRHTMIKMCIFIPMLIMY